MHKNDSLLLGIQYPTKSCPHCLLSRHACLFTIRQTDKPALTLHLLFLLLGPWFTVYASGFSLTFFMSCVKSHLVRTCHYWKPYTYPPSSRRSLFFSCLHELSMDWRQGCSLPFTYSGSLFLGLSLLHVKINKFSFSTASLQSACAKWSKSHSVMIWLLVTPWTIQFMEFSKPEN